MLWFALFLTGIILLALWEIYYWKEWKASLNRNRLEYISEYNAQDTLKMLEECAKSDPNVFLAVMSNRNLDSAMDPLQLRDECRGLVWHPPQTGREKLESGARAFIVTEKAVKQAIMTALNIQDIAQMPKHLHDQVIKTARTLRASLHRNKCKASQLKAQNRKEQQPPNQKLAMSDALAIVPPAPTADDAPLLLNNMSSPIHTIWLPSFVDMLECVYYRYLERTYRKSGFKQVAFHGVPFWVRNLHNGSKTAPPILAFHGIAGIMPMIPHLVPYLKDPSRTIICPAHPALIANMRCHWGKGEMMTTLQFIRHVVSFLEFHRVTQIDLIAWSFGGLQYNYFMVELKLRHLRIQTFLDSKTSLFTTRRQVFEATKYDHAMQPITVRKTVLVEPMGLPISNAVGGSYSLLSWSDALRRANMVAPKARWWHNILAVTHFHRPRTTVPMHTEPIWSQHSFSEIEMWNNANIKLYLSESDIVTPMYLLNEYFKSKISKTQIELNDSAYAEHGSWPEREDFYSSAAEWLK